MTQVGRSGASAPSGSSPKTVEPQEGLDAAHSIPIAGVPSRRLFDDWNLFVSGNGFQIGAPVFGKYGVIAQRGACARPEDTEALAYLLWAAPELYGACHDALGALWELRDWRSADEYENDPATKRLRAAIRKAQGIVTRQGGDERSEGSVERSEIEPGRPEGDAPKGDEG